MFLRWAWEMNKGSNADCVGTMGAPGFVRTWEYIHDKFVEQGVTNVAWLWNPGGTADDPDPAPYYPDPGTVDWIAADAYDTDGGLDFGGVFSHFYRQFLGLRETDAGGRDR
jgi:beta-mannanase